MVALTDFSQLKEEELVQLAKQDDTAMEYLLTKYSDLVWHFAKQYQSMDDAEDLAQEGFFSLVSAVEGFDASKKVKFSTYASNCIVHRLISVHRQNQHCPLPLGGTDSPPFSQICDSDLTPDCVAQGQVMATVLRRKMEEYLTKLEYRVCMEIYRGATYEEASKSLGIPIKSVDNALQRARRKLRDVSEHEL